MMSLTGKVALITGSSRGIGKAIAERYARLGAAIVVNHHQDVAQADQTVEFLKSLGASAISVQADISQVQDVQELFEKARLAFGRIDIVVANAGVELVNLPFANVTEEQFDRMFSINTKGAFFTMQSAAKHLEDNGRIIYIGSSSTAYPMPGYALYGSSKITAHYLVQVLAKEVGRRGIAVNGLIPTVVEGAGIHTVVAEDAPIKKFIADFCPMGRMGTLKDVANVAEFFASDLSSFVSGQLLMVTGGGLA